MNACSVWASTARLSATERRDRGTLALTHCRHSCCVMTSEKPVNTGNNEYSWNLAFAHHLSLFAVFQRTRASKSFISWWWQLGCLLSVPANVRLKVSNVIVKRRYALKWFLSLNFGASFLPGSFGRGRLTMHFIGNNGAQCLSNCPELILG